MRVCLKIPADAEPQLRARLSYAFRLFCAIYGHLPLVDPAQEEDRDVTLRYDPLTFPASTADRCTVWLSSAYRARNVGEAAPPPVRYACNGVNTVLHHAPTPGHAPDWLGEIFEWVSCADEYSVVKRDSVGRLLFACTYAGRHCIDTRVPYAAIAMQCLQQAICRVVPRATDHPRGLDGTAAHLVIPTHDVDYFPLGRMHAVNRLIRNSVISSVLAKDVVLGMRQAAMAARMALGVGTDPLDKITALAEEERRHGILASYYFLVRHAHRRDANYTLEHSGVVEAMHWLELKGMEVGVHGTYTCLDHSYGLKHEVAEFSERGFHPQGGRIHWLRYMLNELIPAVECAGLKYDTSIGWRDRIGFRAGACFAFPPYNFKTESAASFLEIPMVMMDQALQQRHDSFERMVADATEVLTASRRLGWGGISLLWHPAAFGNGWLPRKVGDTYWSLANGRASWEEEWITGSNFVEKAWQRYVEAGLLSAKEPSPVLETLTRDRSEVASAIQVEGFSSIS